MRNLKKLLLFTLLVSFFGINNYSNTLKNKKHYTIIDSLHIFPPIGYINVPSGRELVPNDSLNKIFLENFREVIPNTTNIQVNIMDQEYDLPDTLKKYFVSSTKKFSKLTPDVFSSIPLGPNFNEMVKDLPGRFYGIIFYQGFEQKINYGKEIAKSAAIGLATAALTGGLFYVVTAPVDPYLTSYIVIIDKQENKFLFYKRSYYTGSPLKKEKLQKNYIKVFKKYQ